MENISHANNQLPRGLLAWQSYQTALNRYRHRPALARIPWITWLITIGTCATWWITASRVARASGAHTLHGIIANILANAIDIHNDDILARVLTTYGAKVNSLILAGQYWRFVTPIFLHANLLHVSLNMLNFFILGIFLERLTGPLRFLLIYLVSGVVSIIASFYFAPQEISVGASGAIFGLVGAYSIFVLVHRRALRGGGILALIWLVFIIGVNLALGLVITNVDNYAHVGGLISGCLLGWWFMPRYVPSSHDRRTSWVDRQRLARSWPLALLTIIGTILLATVAVHLRRG